MTKNQEIKSIAEKFSLECVGTLEDLGIIKNLLLDDTNMLRDLVTEINDWNGSLEHLEAQVNDELFFIAYFNDKIYELVRAISYGDYNFNDEYVRFDGLGNLKSITEYEYEQELTDSIDEIMNALQDCIENIDTDDEIEELFQIKDSQVYTVNSDNFSKILGFNFEENLDALVVHTRYDIFKIDDKYNSDVEELVKVSESLDDLLDEMKSDGDERDVYQIVNLDGDIIAWITLNEL